MAFVNPNLTDEELQQQNAAQTGNALATTGPTAGGGTMLGSGGVSAPNAPAGAPSAPAPSSTGSGWTNLRSYLDANKDQSVGLSSQLAGGVKQQGDQAKSAVDTAAQDYNSQLTGATAPNGAALAGQALNDPAKFTKDPNNVSNASLLESGSYGGPGYFETSPTYADLSSKVGSAADMLKSTSDTGGMQNLIRGLNPSMKQGNVDLNNLLVMGSPEARSSLVDATRPYAGLRDYLGNASTTADAARDKSAQDFQTAQNDFKTGFVTPGTQNLQDTENAINKRVADSSTDFEKNSNIQNLLDMLGGKGTLTQPARDTFKLPFGSKADAQAVFNNPDSDPSLRGPAGAIAGGTDPNDVLQKLFPGTSQSSGDLSTASVTNPDEYAKILALQQLLGQSPFLTEDQLGQAGTYKPASIGKYAF